MNTNDDTRDTLEAIRRDLQNEAQACKALPPADISWFSVRGLKARFAARSPAIAASLKSRFEATIGSGLKGAGGAD